MEIRAIAGWRDKARADHVVSKMFARLALGHEGGKNRIERGDDAFVIEILGKKFRQPLAVEGAAEIEIVFAWVFPDEPDLGNVGPCATIRAAGHTDDDLVIAESMGGKTLF